VDVGEVHMGCNPTVSAYLVPGILARFHNDFPHVRVDVIEGDDLELQQLVQQDLLDFAVVTAPGSPQTLEVIPLGTEDILLVVSPQHHLAVYRSIALAKLVDEDFLQPLYAFNIKAHILDACRAAGFEPKTPYRAGSIEAIKNLARQGLGIAAMPSIALRGRGGEGLAIIEVEGGLTRGLNLIMGKERSLSRVAKALAEQVRTSVSESMRYPPRGQSRSGETPAGGETGPAAVSKK
jgi:DNA-binding transcriptional LysR family regulator